MRLIGKGRDDGATDSILSTVSFQQKHGFSIKDTLDSTIPGLVAFAYPTWDGLSAIESASNSQRE
jgi:hypothetical protein